MPSGASLAGAVRGISTIFCGRHFHWADRLASGSWPAPAPCGSSRVRLLPATCRRLDGQDRADSRVSRSRSSAWPVAFSTAGWQFDAVPKVVELRAVQMRDMELRDRRNRCRCG